MCNKGTPFLLLARARTISLKDVFTMGEDKAYEMFRQMRWPDGAPVCPRCEHDESYWIKSRKLYECKACRKQYSVTSGTIFAARKLSFTDLLAAIVIVVNGAKGVSALQLARDLNHQHKAMWILVHKIREAIAAEQHGATLDGVVEVDGMHNGGHVKPANRAEDRVDRRLREHRSTKRRVVIGMREREGRTLTSVVENEADGVDVVHKTVKKNARIHADEASHWDGLYGRFFVHRINHSEAFSDNGICTNQVESYFSRLRRMIRGTHHHVSPQYLHAYASHASWLENHREKDNGALTKRVVGLALAHPASRRWSGYWQRSQK